MKNKTILLVLPLLLFAAMAQPVLAGEAVSITSVKNIDGKIGLYLTNNIGLLMRTGIKGEDARVLTYTIDNKEVSPIPAKSAPDVKVDEDRLVVLDADWPKEKYSVVRVTYTDTRGYDYAPEVVNVFAKPAIEIVELQTKPNVISTTTLFTLSLKVKANGDADVTDIDFDISPPLKYHVVADKSGPRTLKKGEIGEYVFSFKLSGKSMLWTIVSETMNIPVNFNFTYHDQGTSLLLKKKILFYNKASVPLLPELSSLMNIPTKIEQGSTENVSLYIWNSKAKSHEACNIEVTLSEATGKIIIPVRNILLPSNQTFPPETGQPFEPTLFFDVKVPESTPTSDYIIGLSILYHDCEWNSSKIRQENRKFSVVKKKAAPAELDTVSKEEDAQEEKTQEVAETKPASFLQRINLFLKRIFSWFGGRPSSTAIQTEEAAPVSVDTTESSSPVSDESTETKDMPPPEKTASAKEMITDYLEANLLQQFEGLKGRISSVNKTGQSIALAYVATTADPTLASLYLGGVSFIVFPGSTDVTIQVYHSDGWEKKDAKRVIPRSKYNFDVYKNWFPDYEYSECTTDSECDDSQDCTIDRCVENRCSNIWVAKEGCETDTSRGYTPLTG